MAPVTRSQIRSITAALKLRPSRQNPKPNQKSAKKVKKSRKRKPRTNKKKSKQSGEPYRFTPEATSSREVYPVPRPLSPISNMFENIFKKYYSMSKECQEMCSKPKKQVRFDLPKTKKSPKPKERSNRTYNRKNTNSPIASTSTSTSVSPNPNTNFTTTSSSPNPSFCPCSHNSIRSVQSIEPAQSYSSLHMTPRFLTPVPSFLSSANSPEDMEQSTGDDILSRYPNMYIGEASGNDPEDTDDTDDENEDDDEEEKDDEIEDGIMEGEDEDDQEIIVDDLSDQEMVIEEDQLDDGEILPEELKVENEDDEIEIIAAEELEKLIAADKEEMIVPNDDYDMLVIDENAIKEQVVTQDEEEVIIKNEVEIEVVFREESPEINEDLYVEDMDYEDEGICEDDGNVLSDSERSSLSESTSAAKERSLDLNNTFGELDIEEIEKDANNTISVPPAVVSQNDFIEINNYFQNKKIQGNGRNEDENADNGCSPHMRSIEQSQNEVVCTLVNFSNAALTNKNQVEEEDVTCDEICIIFSQYNEHSCFTTMDSEEPNVSSSSSVNTTVKEVKQADSSKIKNLGYADSIKICLNYANDESDISNSDSDIEDEDARHSTAETSRKDSTDAENAAGVVEDASKNIPTTSRAAKRPAPKRRFSSPKKNLMTITGCPVPDVRSLLARQYTLFACPESNCHYMSLHARKIVFHHFLKHPNPFGMYLFHCTECRQRFSCQEILDIHREEHLSHNICPLCLSSFPSYPYLVEHARMHQKLVDKMVKCNYCDLTFINQLYLDRHLNAEARAMKLKRPCHHENYRFPIPNRRQSRKRVRFNMKKEVIENRTNFWAEGSSSDES